MAELLGEPTLLVDPNPRPAGVADGLAAAAAHFGCDVVVLLDVGGDVLAHGDEPGLASPLADAVLLAAAPRLAAAGLRVVGAVFGAGLRRRAHARRGAARLAEVAGRRRRPGDAAARRRRRSSSLAGRRRGRPDRGERHGAALRPRRDRRRRDPRRPPHRRADARRRAGRLLRPARRAGTAARLAAAVAATRRPRRTPTRSSRASASAPSSPTSATAPRRGRRTPVGQPLTNSRRRGPHLVRGVPAAERGGEPLDRAAGRPRPATRMSACRRG